MAHVATIVFYAFAVIAFYRFCRFVTTPLFARMGVYTYHSRMLFSVMMPGNRLELHLGTSYDFFKLQSLNPRQLLGYIADGLLNICTAMEQGSISKEVVLTGCIYFLDHSSLQRFGFKARPLNGLERFMFSLNYLELCLLLSISKGRLCRVRLRDVKIAYCPASVLLANKALIARLQGMLLPKHAQSVS